MSKSKLRRSKNTLKLSQQGYELLDKKVFILNKELEDLKMKLYELDTALDYHLEQGKYNIKEANISVGFDRIKDLETKIDDSLEVLEGSVMGIDVPLVHWNTEALPAISKENMPMTLYKAQDHFAQYKALVVVKAMLTTSIEKIKMALVKTTVRANALDTNIIPKQKRLIRGYELIASESEREEFIRISLMK